MQSAVDRLTDRKSAEVRSSVAIAFYVLQTMTARFIEIEVKHLFLFCLALVTTSYPNEDDECTVLDMEADHRHSL